MSSDDDYFDQGDLYSEIPDTLAHAYYRNEGSHQLNSSEFYGNGSSVPVVNEAATVASHYNARPNVAPSQRTRSAIIHLRQFHNWVKSVLIREFVSQRNLKVLDVACGKGGDLMKWDKADVSVLTGVDIAQVSIDHAQERYKQMRGVKMKASFLVYDAFNKPFPSGFLPLRAYDVVSCQFAFHYCFASGESAHCAFKNVTSSLRRGGYFFGIIPDSKEIRRRLLDPKLCPDERTLQNQFYRLEMDKPVTTPFDSPFGIRYTFTLMDAIDACPEYIVPSGQLKSLAAQYGLELILEAPLPEFFTTFSQVPEYEQLMHRMNIVEGEDLAMSPEELEVAGTARSSVFVHFFTFLGMYTAFSFRKI